MKINHNNSRMNLEDKLMKVSNTMTRLNDRGRGSWLIIGKLLRSRWKRKGAKR